MNKRKLITYMLFITLMLNVFIIFSSQTAEASWYDSNYGYRKKLTITNANNSYPILLNITKTSGGDINCSGHSNDNFSDLRFLALDNTTVLDHWFQKIESGVYAWTWVELAEDCETNDTFWMYYGNTTAHNISNGTSTFFWFANYTTDTTGDWDLVDAGNSIYYSQNISWTGFNWRRVEDINVSVYLVQSTTAQNIVSQFAQRPAQGYFIEYSLFADSNSVPPGVSNQTMVIRTYNRNAGSLDYNYKAKTPGQYDYYKTYYQKFNSTMQNVTIFNQTHINDDFEWFEQITGDIPPLANNQYNITWAMNEANSGTSTFTWKNGWLEIMCHNAGANTIKIGVNWEFVDKWLETEPTISAGAEEADTPANNPPTQSNEYPVNASINAHIDTNLSVLANDTDGHTMNCSFYTNATGTWTFVGSVNGSSNGTKNITTSGFFINFGHEYNWSANITDGMGGWSNTTYNFTTQTFQGIGTTEEYPTAKTNWHLNTNISKGIQQNNGLLVNLTYSTNESGSWIAFYWNNNSVNGTYNTTTSGLFDDWDTDYWYNCTAYVDYNQGMRFTVNSTYKFTTAIPMPVVTVIYPTNRSLGIPYNHVDLRVDVSQAMGQCNFTIFSNYTGSWQEIYNIDSGNATRTVRISNVTESTTYWWNVSVHDNAGNYTNITDLWFKTGGFEIWSDYNATDGNYAKIPGLHPTSNQGYTFEWRYDGNVTGWIPQVRVAMRPIHDANITMLRNFTYLNVNGYNFTNPTDIFTGINGYMVFESEHFFGNNMLHFELHTKLDLPAHIEYWNITYGGTNNDTDGDGDVSDWSAQDTAGATYYNETLDGWQNNWVFSPAEILYDFVLVESPAWWNYTQDGTYVVINQIANEYYSESFVNFKLFDFADGVRSYEWDPDHNYTRWGTLYPHNYIVNTSAGQFRFTRPIVIDEFATSSDITTFFIDMDWNYALWAIYVLLFIGIIKALMYEVVHFKD